MMGNFALRSVQLDSMVMLIMMKTLGDLLLRTVKNALLSVVNVKKRQKNQFVHLVGKVDILKLRMKLHRMEFVWIKTQQLISHTQFMLVLEIILFFKVEMDP